MKIGDRLRRLREKKQLSLDKIAQRGKLNYTDLLEIEIEHKIPPIEILEIIAAVLEIEPYQLFFDGGTPPPLPNFLALQSADGIVFSVVSDASFQIRGRLQQESPEGDARTNRTENRYLRAIGTLSKVGILSEL